MPRGPRTHRQVKEWLLAACTVYSVKIMTRRPASRRVAPRDDAVERLVGYAARDALGAQLWCRHVGPIGRLARRLQQRKTEFRSIICSEHRVHARGRQQRAFAQRIDD